MMARDVRFTPTFKLHAKIAVDLLMLELETGLGKIFRHAKKTTAKTVKNN
jgi:hypothetical protein